RAGSMTRARLITAAAILAFLGSHLAVAQAPTQIGPPVQISPRATKPKAKPKPVVREKKHVPPAAAKMPPAAKPSAKKPGVKAPAAKAPPAPPAESATGFAPSPPPPPPPPRPPAAARDRVRRADRPAGDCRRYSRPRPQCPLRGIPGWALPHCIRRGHAPGRREGRSQVHDAARRTLCGGLRD